ncbi:MAG: hypothetical protein RLY35_477 [Bacteroidota bacterium]
MKPISKLSQSETPHWEWFIALLAVLKKENQPTTLRLEKLLGTEKENPTGEIRGSKFIVPFNSNIKSIALNPILDRQDEDVPPIAMILAGNTFGITLAELTQLFFIESTQLNRYDEGTNFIFVPQSNEYGFLRLTCWTPMEIDYSQQMDGIIFFHFTFEFPSAKPIQ